jgi:hypothetical protein
MIWIIKMEKCKQKEKIRDKKTYVKSTVLMEYSSNLHPIDEPLSTAGRRPGTGPSSYKKMIYWAAVSQRLRPTAVDGGFARSLRLHHRNNICWREQITKLLIELIFLTLLPTNVVLSSLFSDTINVSSSRRAGDEVPHPSATTGKIVA